jgi:hypothetical protein
LFNNNANNNYDYPGAINIFQESISSQNVPQSPSITSLRLADFLQYRLDLHNLTQTNFRPLSSTAKVFLAGLPSYTILSTHVRNGTTIEEKEIGTIVNNKAYIIDYYADSRTFRSNLDVVQNMINSFGITNQPVALSSNVNSYSIYNNGSTVGFHIQYPADWTVSETKQYWRSPTQILPYVNFQSNILKSELVQWPGSVGVWIDPLTSSSSGAYRPLSVPVSLPEYFAKTIEWNSHNFTNFHLDRVATNVTVGGIPAMAMAYTNTNDGFLIQNIEYVAISGAKAKAYVIDYYADAREFPIESDIAQKIIGTMKFSEPYYNTASAEAGNPITSLSTILSQISYVVNCRTNIKCLEDVFK